MTAYLIARIKVTDPEKYKNYTALSPAAIKAFGGKFLVRGGAVETLEGKKETNRVVVLEFKSLEIARQFYHSEQYTLAKAQRAGAAQGQFIIVEGI